ncbi:hypothetical protein [Herbaspirillum sp.]|jgi:hypothetical protein|uniref:hypothetical protein n=1 Tax=Herbaspirillum TaxID=963 RepID=UPI00258310BD|nr:hypothetical protein [Herbaspirillum sp.]MCP3658218.1 hypothetical protein [Herbaspirillum sp.]MCP3950345.1 hypothetical protein [Herbaspirillum sp.]MCP4033571.1 hypothetical protein [Herbaspirillum sp.]MCP4554868.1 hypothetical protein [Herbaspirillum sp.]
MTTQEPTVAAFPFPTLDSAQRAYDALRDRGLTAEQLELRVMDDEAGPSSGNFILEYKETDVHFDSSWMDMLGSRDDPNVGAGRQDVFWSCEALLLVSTRDPHVLNALQEVYGASSTAFDAARQPRKGRPG